MNTSHSYMLLVSVCNLPIFSVVQDSGIPESVCLLDWQLARYASPVTDLLMFLYISTDQSVRAAHWDQLMRAYLEEITSELTTLGCPDPENVFPEAEFKVIK